MFCEQIIKADQSLMNIENLEMYFGQRDNLPWNNKPKM